MTLYDSLLDRYGYGTPFCFDEIKFNDYSTPWIKKELGKMVNNTQIARYEKGMYYIPEKTALGDSILNPYKVIEKKYLSNYSGYFSGLSFANRIGLTTQVPGVIEIYTNNEKSRVREVSINNSRVILRKSRIEVTEENIYVLSFLELMNSFSVDFFIDERKEMILSFIKEKRITREQVTKYSPYFPDRTIRNLIESEIIYEIA